MSNHLMRYITGSALAFLLAACGGGEPQSPLDAGKVRATIEIPDGDVELRLLNYASGEAAERSVDLKWRYHDDPNSESIVWTDMGAVEPVLAALQTAAREHGLRSIPSSDSFDASGAIFQVTYRPDDEVYYFLSKNLDDIDSWPAEVRAAYDQALAFIDEHRYQAE